MSTNTTNYSIGLLILRIGLGGMLLTHGLQKIKILTMDTIAFSDPIGLGPTLSLILTLFAEVICSLFIIIGFKTKWATIPNIILMLVAAFVVHGSDPFGAKEKALLYLVGFLCLFFTGGGRFVIKK
jgi:putative oxidoreductase